MFMRLMATVILAVPLLAACATPAPIIETAPAATAQTTSNVPLPLVAPKGLADLTPEQFAKFDPVVSRYFHYRKQAVIAQDVTILHRAYPELAQGTDKITGINAESDMVTQYRTLDVVDGNVDPERYGRFQVHEDGNTAVLLVNALEMYQRKDGNSSGGPLQLLLFLERRSGVWTIVKTDEPTLAEYHRGLQHN